MEKLRRYRLPGRLGCDEFMLGNEMVVSFLASLDLEHYSDYYHDK